MSSVHKKAYQRAFIFSLSEVRQTKSNILSAALSLFNENGFVNVRLQHIADKSGVSVGNLAYHYANKREILKNIHADVVQKQVTLLKELNIVPLFEHLDAYWEHVFEIQNQYSFFYQDTLEIMRFDPDIALEYRKHIAWGKGQYRNMLEFNVARGVFKYPGAQPIRQKADQMWLIENTWLQGSSIAGHQNSDVEDFKDQLWHCLVPFFSHLGEQEHGQLVKYRKIPS